MKNLYLGIKRFINDEEGVTAIEYGLLAALIAVVIMVGAAAVGTNLNCIFSYIADCIATPSACTGTTGC